MKPKTPRRARLGVLTWLGSEGRSMAHYAYFVRGASDGREARPEKALCGTAVGPVRVREHLNMPTKGEPQPCPRCLSIKPSSPR